MNELLVSKTPVITINKILFLLSVLIVVSSFAVKAGDTVFSTPPDTRIWNPEYMQEVFLDDFNGDHLNTDVWSFDLCKSRGFSGNNEGEPNNVKVGDGTLKLTVHYEPANVDTNCWENTNFVSDYTSAEITTQWDRYKYGCFEAKCFFPRGDHFYYAYWLWGPGGEGYQNDGYISEIDIAEGTEWSDGTNHEMKTSVHYWAQNGGEIKLPKDWSFGYGTDYEGDWHVYKIIWNIYDLIYYIDDSVIWQRSKYYTDMDTTINDVGMNQIIPGIPYHEREYFPNDEMQTIFQMHIQKDVPLSDLPVSMEVEYVKVKQYFLSPEIDCPEVIYANGLAKLDVDTLASNIYWHLSPDSLFEETHGRGTSAEILALPGMSGQAKITWSFKMPSREKFTATHNFLLEEWISANTSLLNENDGTGSLFIFPNPAGEEATISLGEDFDVYQDWNIEIYSSDGHLKMKRNNIHMKDFNVNLSGWQKGVYMVYIKNGKGNLTAKLVVKGPDR